MAPPYSGPWAGASSLGWGSLSMLWEIPRNLKHYFKSLQIWGNGTKREQL